MKYITVKLPIEVILQTYGPDSIADLAKAHGYIEDIPNPEYVPASGEEMIIDPSWEQPEDFGGDVPKIPNPDYVPASGEPTIKNDSHEVYLGKVGLPILLEAVTRPYLDKVTRDAQRNIQNQFKQGLKVVAENAEVIVE
jgi:hypothetical protein